MLNNHPTTAWIGFAFGGDIALVRARPWLCPGSPETPYNPRYPSYECFGTRETIGVRKVHVITKEF